MAAVGSFTVTTADNGGGVTEYTIAWTSSAGGAVSGATFDCKAGTIIKVIFVPDSGGTQPTDLYDVTMTDENSVNVFDDGAGTSVGANLSNSAASVKVPFIGGGTVTYIRRYFHGGQLTPVVANAGAAKGGTIIMYVSDAVL